MNYLNKKLEYKTLLNLGLKDTEKKNFDKAIIFFKKAIKIKPKEIEAYINLGNILLIQKKYDQAIKIFEIVRKINSNHTVTNNNLAYLYNEIKNYELAINIINESLKINSKNFFLINLLGIIFIKIEKIDEGIDQFINSINIKNDFIPAYINLLGILEKTNKIDLFKQYLDKSKNYCSFDPMIILFESIYYFRKKNFEKSIQILSEKKFQKEIKNHQEYLIKYHDILGKNFDKINKTNLAFHHFKTRNDLKSQQYENKKFDKEIVLNVISDYKKFFVNKNISIFNKIDYSELKNPVFLIGFPRSGTTLLDSILRTHSQINVIEEKPIINDIKDTFFSSNDNDINSLKHIDENLITKMQKKYFEGIDKFSDSKLFNKTIVDKFPLNIMEVGFINRIFPKSKFILLLRHPCDVTLSCFITDFKINEAMSNFYNINDTCYLYNEIFTLWTQYTEQLDIDFHTLQYEEVILNFQPTINKLLKFLDLNWENNLFNFNNQVLKRNKINTPSYNQVIEPLYTNSIARWKKYDQMVSASSILKEWIKKFNYK